MKKSKEGRCQCCNKTLTDNSHLVFGDEGRTFNIAALLFNYIKKSLNENDGQKYAICDPCWQQLIQYNEFQQKCIRANEVASDEEMEQEDDTYGVDDNDIDQVEKDANETVMLETHEEAGILYANAKSQHNTNLQYQYDGCAEELDENMQIEYLDENDILDEENWYTQEVSSAVQLPNSGHKKLPFDFTPVLVKPVFMLGIGNS